MTALPPAYLAAAIVLRAAWYAGALGGAGLAFFALAFGRGLEPGEAARLRRWAGAAALLGALAGLAELGAQAIALASGAWPDAALGGVLLASPAGSSRLVGLAGLSAVASLTLGARWAGPAAVGGVAVCAGHLLSGHLTGAASRPLASGLLLIHLLAAAAWVGSLPPLAWAARRGGPGAARLLEAWGRAALLAVPALLAAGLALAWLLVGDAGALADTRYGRALLAKVALVAAMLGLAARHRLRLAPALAAGLPGAGPRLARSIALEAVLAAAVLAGAAVLVSEAPPGAAGP